MSVRVQKSKITSYLRERLYLESRYMYLGNGKNLARTNDNSLRAMKL